MAKRRITHKQTRRIKKKQEERYMQDAPDNIIQAADENAEQNSLNSLNGLVVAHYGSYVDITTTSGQLLRCNLRQNLGTIVVGDQIIWQAVDDNNGVVIAVKPRHSLLSRSISPDKSKPIAANIQQVIVVIAAQPQPAVTLLDSYLAAIENQRMQAVIVFNKIDLLDCAAEEKTTALLDIYRSLQYSVITMSAEMGFGLGELQTQLQDQASIFVGQSGVGKSSLLAKLLPDAAINIGANFATQQRGLHTTTTARLYVLPHGGVIIDSPGIREFSLGDMSPAEIAQGFIEFRDYIDQCKFRNCQHDNPEYCAIQQAAVAGSIHPSRLQSFQRIIAALTSNQKRE